MRSTRAASAVAAASRCRGEQDAKKEWRHLLRRAAVLPCSVGRPLRLQALPGSACQQGFVKLKPATQTTHRTDGWCKTRGHGWLKHEAWLEGSARQ